MNFSIQLHQLIEGCLNIAQCVLCNTLRGEKLVSGSLLTSFLTLKLLFNLIHGFLLHKMRSCPLRIKLGNVWKNVLNSTLLLKYKIVLHILKFQLVLKYCG